VNPGGPGPTKPRGPVLMPSPMRFVPEDPPVHHVANVGRYRECLKCGHKQYVLYGLILAAHLHGCTPVKSDRVLVSWPES
jgi:hypothetical protein